MKVSLLLVLALVCALAVIAESSKLNQGIRRSYAPERPTDAPERPRPQQPTDVPERPTDAPERPQPTAGPQRPQQPTAGPQRPQQPTPGPQRPQQPTAGPQRPQQPTAGPERPTDSDSNDVVICMAATFLCPDNTTATQDDQCQFICGLAPVGAPSRNYVDAVKSKIWNAYGDLISDIRLDTLYGKNVVLTSVESHSDYCLDVKLYSPPGNPWLPAVFDGVRIFYSQAHTDGCYVVKCADSSIACDGYCDSDQGSVLLPFSSILFVVVLSSCCCYVRRRQYQAKWAASAASASQSLTQSQSHSHPQEALYPSEQYELLQQQEEQQYDPSQMAVPIMMVPPMFPPHMMMNPQTIQPQANGQFPPMPIVPPHMMMPNGAYPIMMQGPNGMWFSIPPHPEDV